ncbi:MAG: CRTAC1 family protein [Deltaproteobacteria bacterium]|nr:CRTAC1 family protein [Deltaproteobacteria bacterium]
MTDRLPAHRRHAAKLAAIALIAAVGSAVGLPELGADERSALASRFHFAPVALEEWSEGPHQTRRSVNPSLERHSGWISAVGAAVALADIDGDGLANDVCQVDPRTDRVTIAPVPGSGARYPITALSAGSLPYDAATMAPMGCVPGDFNEDGRTDLFVYYWGRTPISFLSRAAPGEKPSAAGYVPLELSRSGERWYTNAATFADIDGDGHADLLIGNYFQDGARILDAGATEPDSMQHSMSRAYNGGKNRVFLWSAKDSGTSREPRVAYREVAGVFDELSLHAWTLAIGAADLDGDLRPELYFANDFGPDRLYRNASRAGRPRFELVEGKRGLDTPRSRVLGRDSFKGMGVDFADVNGDGRLDFFISNIADDYALLESHFLFVSDGEWGSPGTGVAPYSDQGDALGVARSSWGWDTRFGDFDNDGVPEAVQATGFAKGDTNRWPELQELATANDELLALAGTWPRFQAGDDLSGHAPNPFYARASDGRYYDLSAELGIDQPQVSRGIATADVDGDGDLDFAVANQWEPSVFYRNERSGAANAFLGLHLAHPVGGAAKEVRVRSGHPDGASWPAIGAAATVRRADGRVLVGQVDGGNGHSGVRSPELHFGLGDAGDRSSRVLVRYRDRFGRPAQVELDLASGWHTVVLPDAPDPDWLVGAAAHDERAGGVQ